MNQAVQALARALQQKDFDVLAPYLDASYHIDQVGGDFARQTLRQVVTGGMRAATAIHVDSVRQDGDRVRVDARFDFASGSRPVELVMTRDGKFVELPFFRMMMTPGGGMPPGGAAVRMGAPGMAAPPSGPVANPALRDTLLAMRDDDQHWRRVATEGVPAGQRPNLSPEILRHMAASDTANEKRLAGIVQRHGWPGSSMVGQDGSLAAFLVLQHASLAAQERYLPMLRDAAARHELAPSLLAMLEDRVRLQRHQPQIYGTQMQENPATHRLELYTLEDPARVDERRASVGLPPLADYLAHFGVQYTPPARHP
jgi:hypothetical protein